MSITGVIISAEYHADIKAVEADPIAIAMAAEVPADNALTSLGAMTGALREYERRGGVHGTTHMGAVVQALRNLRAGG